MQDDQELIGMAKLSFRYASIHDLPVLQQWDRNEHVINSDPNDDWNWQEELLRTPTWREQLIAEVDGKPIGFIQIIDPAEEESHYWGNVERNLRAIDIWIGEEEYLGKGFGTQMTMLFKGVFQTQTSREFSLIHWKVTLKQSAFINDSDFASLPGKPSTRTNAW